MATVAGAAVVDEARRRRRVEGAGADRSWRVGAAGEVAVAELLALLTEPSRWDRLRGRRPAWRVLHVLARGLVELRAGRGPGAEQEPG